MSDAARKKPPGMRPVGFFNLGCFVWAKQTYLGAFVEMQSSVLCRKRKLCPYVTGALHFCKKWYMIVDTSDCSNLPFQFVLMLDKSIEKAGEQT